MKKPPRKKFLRTPKPGYTYVYRGGKYYGRITAEEGTEEFDRQYWEILSGKRATEKRSWRAAVELLRKSDRWSALSPRYRADLEPVFAYIVEKIGGHDVSRLTDTQIHAAMDANRHRTRFANYLPVAITLLAKEAKRSGWLKDNPAREIERLRVPEERKKPHVPWPDWAVEKFRAEAAPLPRLIFEIGVGSVQRPGDWVKFAWGDFDGDALSLRQGKTGKELTLPCTAELRAALARARAALAFAPLPSKRILCEEDGAPMGYNRMAAIMLAERKRLGLQAFDQHALRYRGVMELAWAGCSDDEIASYSGHSSKAMIVKYAGIARQIMRARQAREKRG